jgi:hypothetical protein
MSNILPSRILAVEVRSARFGYALFEKPRRLIDFGATSFDSPLTARSRIRRLLQFSHPSLLVLRKSLRRKASAQSVVTVIRNEARKCAVPLIFIANRSFKSHYDSHSCRTKYDRAVFIAKLIPEIAWRLPPSRKFYEPEPLAMIYFDSIALAVAHLELANEKLQTEVR